MDEKFNNIGDSIIDNFLKKVTPEIQNDANYKMKLAAKIFAGMKAKKWNKDTLAKKVKKSNSIVTKWFSGYHNFETDTLIEIEKVLDIQLLNLEIQEGQNSDIIRALSTSGLPPVDMYGGKVDINWHSERITENFTVNDTA